MILIRKQLSFALSQPRTTETAVRRNAGRGIKTRLRGWNETLSTASRNKFCCDILLGRLKYCSGAKCPLFFPRFSHKMPKKICWPGRTGVFSTICSIGQWLRARQARKSDENLQRCEGYCGSIGPVEAPVDRALAAMDN